jgi:hypothetical protein
VCVSSFVVLNDCMKDVVPLANIYTNNQSWCPIANTRVKHSKKAKLNMHMTVNFLGLFFRTGKIFFGLTRSSCLSVRMTDNFSASFGKSGHAGILQYPGRKYIINYWGLMKLEAQVSLYHSPDINKSS